MGLIFLSGDGAQNLACTLGLLLDGVVRDEKAARRYRHHDLVVAAAAERAVDQRRTAYALRFVVGIKRCERQNLCELPGMGLAKYAQLKALMEMARRAHKEKITYRSAQFAFRSARVLAFKLQSGNRFFCRDFFVIDEEYHAEILA